MREYYEKVLASTYMIFGVNQLEKMDDDQLQFLLDGLEGVSKLYSYIPEEFQKKIIRARMLKDKDYKNINLNLIARWFEEDGKQFFQQECHKEIENQPEPVSGEERSKWLRIWEQTLKEVEKNFIAPTVERTGSRLRNHFEHIAPKPEGYIAEELKPLAVKSFLVDGIEVFAKSQEEANHIFYGTTPNQEGIKGTGEATRLPENSNPSSQQDNGV